jgi:hypothetical protein
VPAAVERRRRRRSFLKYSSSIKKTGSLQKQCARGMLLELVTRLN